MRYAILILSVFAASCGVRETVYREYQFCKAEGTPCYNVEMVQFIRDRSYWEGGSASEEVRARAYRIVEGDEDDLSSSIAYCPPSDPCFVADTRLAICDRRLALRVIADAQEAPAEPLFEAGCEILRREFRAE